MSMKKLILPLLIAAVVLFAWNGFNSPRAKIAATTIGRPITMCGSFLFPDSSLAPARIFSGLGILHYKITTTSPKAQEFFDQGLRLMYGYNQF